jgi:hypothetical protein
MNGPASVQIPWQQIAHAAPRHSILLWLGDFPPGPQPEGWPVIRRRYQVFTFRVDDPWDRELPRAAAFGAYDPVGERIVVLDPRSRAQRERHAEWRAERENAFRQLQPDSHSRLIVSTGDDMLEAMVAFFRARMGATSRR